jgi:hypothetical protein
MQVAAHYRIRGRSFSALSGLSARQAQRKAAAQLAGDGWTVSYKSPGMLALRQRGAPR